MRLHSVTTILIVICDLRDICLLSQWIRKLDQLYLYLEKAQLHGVQRPTKLSFLVSRVMALFLSAIGSVVVSADGVTEDDFPQHINSDWSVFSKIWKWMYTNTNIELRLFCVNVLSVIPKLHIFVDICSPRAIGMLWFLTKTPAWGKGTGRRVNETAELYIFMKNKFQSRGTNHRFLQEI